MKIIAINSCKKLNHLFLFIFFSVTLNAQTISIPDSEFESYLIAEGIDSDGVINGSIPESDVINVTNFDMDGYDIADFEGLQYFTDLTTFIMRNNFSSLNAINFDNNLLLEEMRIYDAPSLANVDVTQNIALTFLVIYTYGNAFSTINLTNNINLETVALNNSNITSLNLDTNVNINYLDLGFNPLTEIDLSNLSLLQNLSLYESSVESIDLSQNPQLSYFNGSNGQLNFVNLKSGANATTLTSVFLTNNPNLNCILVDDFNYSSNAPNWQKDPSASYVENPTTLVNSAQDLIITYDGSGNQVEVNNWLGNNGGAEVTCNNVIWSYEVLFENIFEDTLTVTIGFTATDDIGNEAFTSATITYNQFANAGESTGSNGVLCGVESYDLGTITGLDPSAPKFQSSSFSTTQLSGPQGVSISSLDVEFPDTGAGQFAYSFRVEVTTYLTIGNSETLEYTSEAFLTVNDVTIPFDPGPDKTVVICDFQNINLANLYLELDIAVDVDESGESFGSEEFLPENYWFDLDDNPITEITEPGTYRFNPTAFLPDCGAETTDVTLTEAIDLSAGIDVVTSIASEFTCGDTVNLDLSTFLDETADLGGVWFDSSGNEIADNIVTFVDVGPGQFTSSFIYRHESISCGYLSEATYEISYEIAELNVGSSSTIDICAGITLTEQELLDQLGADSGGFWDPPINDPSSVQPGTYIYSHGDCGLGETSSVEIIEEVELMAGDNVPDAIDSNTYSCGDTVILELNTFLDNSADLGGIWYDSNGNEVAENRAEFPDTGAGQFTKSFFYRQENDNCGFFSEALYDITYDVSELSVGNSSILEVCSGTIVTEQDLIDELEADNGGFWSPSIDPLNVGAGIYFYSHGDCGVSGDSSIEVVIGDCEILVSPKIYLQGAFVNPNVGEEMLMRDDLRLGNYLPETSPYDDELTCDISVFNDGGTSGVGAVNNDIVDWVYLELRDKNDPSIILYERSALLQRDGSVVEVDGLSDVSFLGIYDNYYISVKHRNHLGIMSNSTISLNGISTAVDFTDSSLNTYGSNSQVAINPNIKALWAGDVNMDGQIRYLGPSNDTNSIKNVVLNELGNTTNSNFYPFNGYHDADIDMDGQIRYLGPGNDTNILKFIILSHPSNTTLSNFFPFTSSIPN